MFKSVRVGDKVWSFSCGDGIISCVNPDKLESYRFIQVWFEKGFCWYGHDGKFAANTVRPDLYLQSFEVPIAAYELPEVPKYQWLYLDAKGEYKLSRYRYADKMEAEASTGPQVTMLCPICRTKQMEKV